MRRTKNIDILGFIFGGYGMTMHYMDRDAKAKDKLVEIFWIAILYIGYPILTIIEWLHWEIYGKGPTEPKR